ncbi:unnamed protein product, partial [Larinioides sclopetarius]
MSINDNSLFDRILKISNDNLKLIRITSFLFRFINNVRFPKLKNTGPLSYLENVFFYLLNASPNFVFGTLYQTLKFAFLPRLRKVWCDT